LSSIYGWPAIQWIFWAIFFEWYSKTAFCSTEGHRKFYHTSASTGYKLIVSNISLAVSKKNYFMSPYYGKT
jgi:hypothetical protein